MRIAVIGAGLAGLTAAKQALGDGHDVTVYEALGDLGGIWNPNSGGAYESVRMQSSRMSFPFSDFPPPFDDDFPTLVQLHGYLRDYAEHFGVLPRIRFDHPVTDVTKVDGRWSVTAGRHGRSVTASFDAVMVANGELWHPRMPVDLPDPRTNVVVYSAKEYRRPSQFAGKRVLVVGGGVSGADISAELVGVAASVDWSVRHRALFLPRDCAGTYNDALFSYIGRVAVEEMPYGDWLAFLDRLMPEYMADYRATGLLPEHGFHHAVHVNEKIIPRVRAGEVRVRPAFDLFADDGAVVFADRSLEDYDVVLFCLGYAMPDYSFITGFRREDLYEHHFYRFDPTLAVVNTPVDTDAFGTACPYFEAIAAWVLAVYAGKVQLPDADTRAAWCAEHMSRLDDRRHFDCWLETIRIGLASGALPDPAVQFTDYWNIVASIVSPANLRPNAATFQPARYDDLFDLSELRLRVLAALTRRDRDRLVSSGQITVDDAARAAAIPADRAIHPRLPYKERA
jgi:cation diffusion facilitator CzcD-associated flavoprotein CzcO